jgi:hypothetical protein
MVCIKYTILKTNLITCRFEIFDWYYIFYNINLKHINNYL